MRMPAARFRTLYKNCQRKKGDFSHIINKTRSELARERMMRTCMKSSSSTSSSNHHSQCSTPTPSTSKQHLFEYNSATPSPSTVNLFASPVATTSISNHLSECSSIAGEELDSRTLNSEHEPIHSKICDDREFDEHSFAEEANEVHTLEPKVKRRKFDEISTKDGSTRLKMKSEAQLRLNGSKMDCADKFTFHDPTNINVENIDVAEPGSFIKPNISEEQSN